MTPYITETRYGKALLSCSHVVNTPIPVVDFECRQCQLEACGYRMLRFDNLDRYFQLEEAFRKQVKHR